MFVLGVVLPAIKLASFKGLPMTKTIGMIWIVSLDYDRDSILTRKGR